MRLPSISVAFICVDERGCQFFKVNPAAGHAGLKAAASSPHEQKALSYFGGLRGREYAPGGWK